MRHLSSVLTLALIAGIAGGVGSDAPVVLIAAVTMSAAWAAALLAFLRGFVRAQLAAICFLVAGAGWVLGAHAVAAVRHPPLRATVEQRAGGDPVLVEGRLREDAAIAGSGLVLRIDVERVAINGTFETAAGGISVGVAGAMQSQHLRQWTAGRLVRAPAMLRRPARYLNEGLPDQEQALARRGVALVGTIKSAALIEIVARGSWWQEAAAGVRARTRAALLRYVATRSAESSAIATAILIGDRAALTPEVEHRLQEAGTFHVIAISGGNIAILAGFWLGGLGLFGIRGRVASVIGIAALVAYSIVAIGGATVLRATLMAVIYLFARAIDHRTAATNALSLTATVVLLTTPLAIVDVGFWLTFGATLALLAASRATKDTKGTKGFKGLLRRVVDGIALLVMATACVELVLAPIAAFVFQRVTLAGLLLNVVAIPAMTVVQIGAMAIVAADMAALPWIASKLGACVHLASMVLVESARLLDYAPWLTWRVPSPHVMVIAAYYLTLVAAVLASLRASCHRPFRWSTTLVVTGLFVWIVSAPAVRVRALGDGRLHLTKVDVGQGDSMLVTFPNGQTLLVDTGGGAPSGDFDIGDRVIGPTLRHRGVLRLDYLAVTHGDPDHIGGAKALLREFAADEVWWGVPVANHEPTANVRTEADRHRVGWRTLQRGDRIEIGSVDVLVHHPPSPDWERQRVRNNDSLVIELRFGSVSMLLTGDIGGEVEAELVRTLDPLPITILKVPHHGSATSSSLPFLETIRPRVAVIGVGRGNTYGHPVPSVLGRLHDAGAEVFRTDLDGQIEVITDGTRVEVRTFTGRTFHIGS